MGQRVRGHTARNEITGKFIKSDPPTKLYADNHDKIFAKKPATEWIQLEDHKDDTLDNFTGDKDELIKYKEFKERMNNNG